MAKIRLEKVNYTYSAGTPFETRALRDVEFEIKQAIFIDSKTAYVLTTTVPGELKDENSETIDNIISSFMK